MYSLLLFLWFCTTIIIIKYYIIRQITLHRKNCCCSTPPTYSDAFKRSLNSVELPRMTWCIILPLHNGVPTHSECLQDAICPRSTINAHEWQVLKCTLQYVWNTSTFPQADHMNTCMCQRYVTEQSTHRREEVVVKKPQVFLQTEEAVG